MKRLLFLITIILLASCSSKSDSVSIYGTADEVQKVKKIKTEPKYSIGDVVWLKPDSLKVVVTMVHTIKITPEYDYYYHTSNAESGTFRKSGRTNQKLIY